MIELAVRVDFVGADGDLTVDLVEFFDKLPLVHRESYGTDVPVNEWDRPWEAPISYLVEYLTDEVGGPTVPHSPGVFGYLEDVRADHVRVVKRAGERTAYVDMDWTEDDYKSLLKLVPWLAEHDRQEPQDRAAAAGPFPGQLTLDGGIVS